MSRKKKQDRVEIEQKIKEKYSGRVVDDVDIENIINEVIDWILGRKLKNER